jgi:hypothetical protein
VGQPPPTSQPGRHPGVRSPVPAVPSTHRRPRSERCRPFLKGEVPPSGRDRQDVLSPHRYQLIRCLSLSKNAPPSPIAPLRRRPPTSPHETADEVAPTPHPQEERNRVGGRPPLAPRRGSALRQRSGQAPAPRSPHPSRGRRQSPRRSRADAPPAEPPCIISARGHIVRSVAHAQRKEECCGGTPRTRLRLSRTPALHPVTEQALLLAGPPTTNALL